MTTKFDYEPDIPQLTPTTLKNEGVLYRLTEHLRSLIIYPGEGIRIDRQGYGTRISLDVVPSGGGGGDATEYAGLFAVTDNGDDTLDIAAGVVVNGITNTTVALEDDLSVSGNTHVSLEIWYNVTWKTNYLTGSAFPTQGVKDDGGTDFPCLRVLIAEKVDSVWSQYQYGAIYNVRVA